MSAIHYLFYLVCKCAQVWVTKFENRNLDIRNLFIYSARVRLFKGRSPRIEVSKSVMRPRRKTKPETETRSTKLRYYLFVQMRKSESKIRKAKSEMRYAPIRIRNPKSAIRNRLMSVLFVLGLWYVQDCTQGWLITLFPGQFLNLFFNPADLFWRN